MIEENRIRSVYKAYELEGKTRAYRWHPRNPISVKYRHQFESACVAFLNKYNVTLDDARLLDVGCGNGGNLAFLSSLACEGCECVGVELLEDRVDAAQNLLGNRGKILCGSAEHITYPDCYFNVQFIGTVFSSILDDEMRRNIAFEMHRVTADDGYILIYEMAPWATARSENLRGLSKSNLMELFPKFKLIGFEKMNSFLLPKIASNNLLSTLCEAIPLIPKTNFLGLLKKVDS